MPTVIRFRRCHIEMYFGDHSPPHFHVITISGDRVVLVIETGATMAGSVKAKDVAEAKKWAESNRDELMRL